MDKAHLAAEAQKLKDNEAFQHALAQMRMTALEGLARTPATDTEAIRDYQATVRVVDDLHGSIAALIRGGAPRKATGIV